MTGASAANGKREAGPFIKTALVLWVLGIIGGLLVLPYVTTLEAKAIAAAAARTHIDAKILLAMSMTQTAVLLAVAVLAGLWASRKLGLGTPLIAAALTGGSAPGKAPLTLSIAVVAGIATGLGLVELDRSFFAHITSLGALTLGSAGNGPPSWQGFLASFYGAFDEEILMRLCLLPLLALALRTFVRWDGKSREVLPSGVFWIANIATALVFGLGHLPATAALVPLTPLIVVRALVLNGTAGIVFGVLYRRYGLEWAMASHFSADLVLHVVLA